MRDRSGLWGFSPTLEETKENGKNNSSSNTILLTILPSSPSSRDRSPPELHMARYVQ